MPAIRKTKHFVFLLLLIVWAVMGGFVLPYLVSKPSTFAVILGVVLLLALLLLTFYLTPNPYEKEPSE